MALVAGLLCLGVTTVRADWSVSATFGSGPNLHHQKALTEAVEAFVTIQEPAAVWPGFGFGPRAASRPDVQGSAGATVAATSEETPLQLSGDDIALDSDTPYTQYPGVFFGVTLERDWRLGRGMALIPSLTFGVGRDRYYLPEGVAPFVDPITVRFVFVAAVPELALEQVVIDRKWGAAALRLTAGAEMVRGETTAKSALLDVHHFGTYVTPYGGLALVGRQGKGPFELHLGVRVVDYETRPNLYWSLRTRF